MGDLLLVGLFLGLVLWVGWPVTLWVGCAGVLAWVARATARRSAVDRVASKRGVAAVLDLPSADRLGVGVGVGIAT